MSFWPTLKCEKCGNTGFKTVKTEVKAEHLEVTLVCETCGFEKVKKISQELVIIPEMKAEQ